MVAEASTQQSVTSATRTQNTQEFEGSMRKDPLYLHSSDNPGLVLVTHPLTMTNFIIWSRSMSIALKAKNKLGFVDGSFPQPEDVTSDAHLQWSLVDSMVTSWIVNSMTKELSEAYIYSPSARQLWIELEEKFGQGDKSRVFNIKKQLAEMKQGNDSLATYSNNLKKLWEELNCLEPPPRCSCSGCKCDVYKKQEVIDSSNKLMQFLMGLNDSYGTVVSNILLLDPLPSFNKAYSIISRVERQKTDTSAGLNQIESSALAVRGNDQEKFTTAARNFGGKRDTGKKGDRVCTHCHKMGHLEEACFKKHGYPEWFKDYKNQTQKPKKGQSYANNVALNSFSASDIAQELKDSDSPGLAEIIQQEVQKFLKGKSAADNNGGDTSCFVDFAGPFE